MKCVCLFVTLVEAPQAIENQRRALEVLPAAWTKIIDTPFTLRQINSETLHTVMGLGSTAITAVVVALP